MGTTSEALNGKRMFLVPAVGPATAETVDSVVVKDRRFEFFTDSTKVAIIRPAYFHRTFSQDLLVVTEPGEIEVTIDTISSSRGTKLNNLLQQWKTKTEEHNRIYAALLKRAGMDLKAGDSASHRHLRQVADSVHNAYTTMTRAMTDSLDDGPLKQFLRRLYPVKTTTK